MTDNQEPLYTDAEINAMVVGRSYRGGMYQTMLTRDKVQGLLTIMRDNYESDRRCRHDAAPPLDDIRAVLDWMHTEVATSSQAGIIEPGDRDRLLALAGRVEAWLVEQGEAV